MLVGDSGTWPAIVGIGVREEEWQKGGGRIEGINEHLNNLKGVENLESLN